MNTEIQVLVQQELEKFISNPDNVIQAYQKALEVKNQQIQQLIPKAEMWDVALGSDNLLDMKQVAKVLNFKNSDNEILGRNELFELLRQCKILSTSDSYYDRNEPYQKYVDAGYFKVVEQIFTVNDNKMINRKTMVTQKGMDYIRKKLLENGYEFNKR